MRYVRNEAVLGQKVDDSVILLSADQSDLLTLNAAGAAIWQALLTPGTVDDVVDRVTAEWPGLDTDIIRTDAAMYLEKLASLGVVRAEG
ncbi:MAG: hypothetical protein JWM93_367 [Frankiales bacterium]|nr:hypothetical protein [Frankiales bacterium]